jgi:hypothetical protein
VTDSGAEIKFKGANVFVGAVGMPVVSLTGKAVKSAEGSNLQFSYNGTIADNDGKQYVGTDGRAILVNSRGLLLNPVGDLLLDRKGKAVRVAENGNVVDGSGKEIKSLTGKTLTISSTNKTISIKIGGKAILAPNGKAVRVALNGQVFDAGGFQVLAANGNPIFVDSVKKSLVDTSGSAVKVGDGQKVVGRIGKATN